MTRCQQKEKDEQQKKLLLRSVKLLDERKLLLRSVRLLDERKLPKRQLQNDDADEKNKSSYNKNTLTKVFLDKKALKKAFL